MPMGDLISQTGRPDRGPSMYSASTSFSILPGSSASRGVGRGSCPGEERSANAVGRPEDSPHRSSQEDPLRTPTLGVAKPVAVPRSSFLDRDAEWSPKYDRIYPMTASATNLWDPEQRASLRPGGGASR
jgi:hypothetical protein